MERITNRLSSIGQAGHYDVRRTSENMVLDPGDVVMEDRLQRTFSSHDLCTRSDIADLLASYTTTAALFHRALVSFS